MGPTRAVSVATLLLASVTFTTVAQSVTPLAAGARVRVRLRTGTQPVVGILDSISRDTVWLGPAGERAASRVALSTADGIDLSRGPHANTGKGALWGGVVLGTLSALTGAALASGQGFFSISGGEAVRLTVAGTAFGAGVGALIGSLVRSEKWKAIPLSSVQVAPVSLSRVGITVSLSF